jgi:UDP-4-amino-4-deoxy-L-arabinose-oxoglutarate aminotransferase
MVAEEVFTSVIPHSKPWITEADQKAVVDVLNSRMIAQGDQVRLFEETCARYLGVPNGVAMGSGTAALTLALWALGLKKGGEVILPTYVCKNVAEAILNAGCVPVFCDVGHHWNMTAKTVADVLTKRAIAIIVIHLFGIPTHLDDFEKFGLPIIEDACQAFGAKAEERIVGTMGTIGIFSFHATKCLTTGEGGLAISNDPKLLERMRKLRDGEDYPEIRVTSPMTDLQAALGISQLSRYPVFLKQRRSIAESYFEALSDCPVALPDAVRNESIFFRFPIRVSGKFQVLRQRFAEKGVHVRQGVDVLLHRIMNNPSKKFSTAERLFAETVSLPIYPALTEGEQKRVIQVSQEIWR